MNISVMTTKQWYRILLEDRILMHTPADGAPQTLHPVRVELMTPDLDWPAIWILSRTKGLSSEQSAFLFKLLHLLLPTQDRISRITNVPGLCNTCNAAAEYSLHALFSCPSSHDAASTLLSYVHITAPGISPQAMLRLHFGQALNETDCPATLSIISTGLQHIWLGLTGKQCAPAG